MSTISRKTLICLLAVFAVGAFASASSASAFNLEWQRCKEKTGAGTEPPTKYDNLHCNSQEKALAERKWEFVKLEAAETEKIITSGGEFKLTAGTKIVTCKKVIDLGSITGGIPGQDEAKRITFEECSTSEAKCQVKSKGGTFGTIVVSEIPTTLVEREPNGGGTKKLADEFKSNATTKEFVTLQFEKEGGGACTTLPETKVKGQVAAEIINLTNGNVELNFPTAELKGNTLEAFGVASKLTGKDTEELESGSAFRAL
jgi:hypothetical protein